MSVGLPVVATAVGGVPQFVADCEEGLLVPQGAPTFSLTLSSVSAPTLSCAGASEKAQDARAPYSTFGRRAPRLKTFTDASSKPLDDRSLGNVSFAGHCNDAEVLHRGFGLTVQAISREELPRSAMEAAPSGPPVVATDK